MYWAESQKGPEMPLIAAVASNPPRCDEFQSLLPLVAVPESVVALPTHSQSVLRHQRAHGPWPCPDAFGHWIRSGGIDRKPGCQSEYGAQFTMLIPLHCNSLEYQRV